MFVRTAHTEVALERGGVNDFSSSESPAAKTASGWASYGAAEDLVWPQVGSRIGKTADSMVFPLPKGGRRATVEEPPTVEKVCPDCARSPAVTRFNSHVSDMRSAARKKKGHFSKELSR